VEKVQVIVGLFILSHYGPSFVPAYLFPNKCAAACIFMQAANNVQSLREAIGAAQAYLRTDSTSLIVDRQHIV
jgi:hypothetical protein